MVFFIQKYLCVYGSYKNTCSISDIFITQQQFPLFVARFPPITVIKKPSKFEGFHFIYKQINYFAASPQAGTTVFISGLSIFIEHAIT